MHALQLYKIPSLHARAQHVRVQCAPYRTLRPAGFARVCASRHDTFYTAPSFDAADHPADAPLLCTRPLRRYDANIWKMLSGGTAFQVCCFGSKTHSPLRGTHSFLPYC